MKNNKDKIKEEFQRLKNIFEKFSKLIEGEFTQNHEITERDVIRQIMQDLATKTDFRRHSIDDDGDRHNYDCIGIALGAAKIIADNLGLELYSKKNYNHENQTLELFDPDFEHEVLNSEYNQFGMWNLLNFSEEIPPELLRAGDWIVWQKLGALSHGHVVTVIRNGTKLEVLSGTTNGFPSIDIYKDFKDINQKYQRMYGKPGKCRRPTMIERKELV